MSSEKTAEVDDQDFVLIAGDLNGHIGADKEGYACHGGFGFGTRNSDGERILEYATSHDLVITNSIFRKRPSHLATFYSGEVKTQIDFILIRRRDRKQATDAKVVPYETVAPQHRPLICKLKLRPLKQGFAPRNGQERKSGGS